MTVMSQGTVLSKIQVQRLTDLWFIKRQKNYGISIELTEYGVHVLIFKTLEDKSTKLLGVWRLYSHRFKDFDSEVLKAEAMVNRYKAVSDAEETMPVHTIHTIKSFDKIIHHEPKPSTKRITAPES